MTPVVLETTVRIPDIISMVTSLAVAGAAVLWVKSTLAKHDAALFNEKGESRLVPLTMALAKQDAALFNEKGESRLVPLTLALARHDAMLFNDTGEPRLVSFSAHDRMSLECRRSISKDSGHQNEHIERLIGTISDLSAKIDKLRQCVTTLSLGGKPDDC